MALFNNRNKPMPIPPNRFLQFFYLIKENFLLLFYTSITYFAFSLPLIYILLSTYVRYSNLINNNPTSAELFKILIIGGILIIPTMLILSIATIGMHNIIKKISYNEPAQYKDFFNGIKENYLKTTPLFIIDSIFSAVVIINYAIYLYADINSYFKLISLIISIILFLTIKIIKPFFMTQYAIFENNKFQVLKNSFVFGNANLIRNLGFFILSNILIIILFFLPEQMRVINIVIMIILGGAYNILISHLNSLCVIEKYMDKEKYSSVYHKGLADFYKEDFYA